MILYENENFKKKYIYIYILYLNQQIKIELNY